MHLKKTLFFVFLTLILLAFSGNLDTPSAKMEMGVETTEEQPTKTEKPSPLEEKEQIAPQTQEEQPLETNEIFLVDPNMKKSALKDLLNQNEVTVVIVLSIRHQSYYPNLVAINAFVNSNPTISFVCIGGAYVTDDLVDKEPGLGFKIYRDGLNYKLFNFFIKKEMFDSFRAENQARIKNGQTIQGKLMKLHFELSKIKSKKPQDPQEAELHKAEMDAKTKEIEEERANLNKNTAEMFANFYKTPLGIFLKSYKTEFLNNPQVPGAILFFAKDEHKATLPLFNTSPDVLKNIYNGFLKQFSPPDQQ